jgi:hypothetical protein
VSAAWLSLAFGAAGLLPAACCTNAPTITGTAPTIAASWLMPCSARSAAIAARTPSTMERPSVACIRAGSRWNARSRALPSAARTSASLIGFAVAAVQSRAVTPSKLEVAAR